ncbi:D-TA family PLP-dependent enzyme [Chitinophaga filiformis]|uniref:D-serine deaminase, pyridoxal phosphate-dependent n=1 Tax=Chitinophaga filiformis TaxID=104663 RepID=A0A1G7GQM5_CHIFI|nr:D-TA family PLP-dependent enzyme [Chitinophaga filiformis]SDE90468.1 D-serine deaminase, pyridoxal phosphate-dependent [Chitinophaga filiformis]
MHWYELHNINTVDTPAVLVYPERMRENILLLKKTVSDVQRLRPHIKTSKMVEAVQLLKEEGINKFKCATIAEAEMLGLAGAADVLLAYQPMGPKISRLLQVVEQYPDTKYSCLVDNRIAAMAIAAVFHAAKRTIPVYLDLNIGMNRTGIPAGDAALELYQELQHMPGITPVGLHAYDGQLHDTDVAVRREKCNAGFAPAATLAAAITATGAVAPQIIAGGTPTYAFHAERPGVECSPGTFIFWDWGYRRELPEQDFAYAAVVVTRVISIIDDKHLCVDLGHKSIASEMPQPRVLFLDIPGATPKGHSEEHMVVEVPDTSLYPVGTVFYGVPVHICPTVALQDRVGVVEDNNCVAYWKVIARDRKIMI